MFKEKTDSKGQGKTVIPGVQEETFEVWTFIMVSIINTKLRRFVGVIFH